MNENFTSLVFFTVLSQTAVGTLIFRWLMLLRQGIDNTPFDFRRISLVVITILLILSLAIAFLHIGKPTHSFYAINNLGKSWLSREVFSLSLLITTLLLSLLFITRNDNGKREIMISFITIIAGISLLFSMIKLYMIPSITAWNNSFTPVSFIITTCLCGIILLAVISGKSNYGFISILVPVVAVFIISSIINSILFNGSFLKQGYTLFIIRAALSVLSLFLTAVIYFRSDSNKTFILWVILFMIVISSEIINRYIFFLSFEKSGL
jgi:anaerobic dimethyl sulfoxide reductase subunit C